MSTIGRHNNPESIMTNVNATPATPDTNPTNVLFTSPDGRTEAMTASDAMQANAACGFAGHIVAMDAALRNAPSGTVLNTTGTGDGPRGSDGVSAVAVERIARQEAVLKAQLGIDLPPPVTRPEPA